MSDRLPLANGSEWDGDTIVEYDGAHIELRKAPPGVPGFEAGSPFFQVGHSDDSGCAWPENLRAILEANGYLPEVDELAKLREAARELCAVLGRRKDGNARWYDVLTAATRLESLLPNEDNKDG